MPDMIRLRCKNCGKIVERRKTCPYTGIEHGRGWVYICECRGEMEIIDSDKLIDILAGDGDELWGTSVLEDINFKPGKVGNRIFDALAAAGKMMDDTKVPTKNRTLKMWTFEDKEI
jgi:RNA polymerase subunit RPABC4/transcription elongation factor Spt4